MAIQLSSLITIGTQTQETAFQDAGFHALSRTSDGMLVYTQVKSNDTDIINFTNAPMDPSHPKWETGYGINEDDVLAVPSNRSKNPNGDKNSPLDTYSQYRWDERKLNYFIDSDGYLVARVGQNYNYSLGPQ